MKHSNLDQIELAPYRDIDMAEPGDKIPSRWEIMSRNADIPWRYGIPSLGENLKTGFPNNLHSYTGWYALSFEVNYKMDEYAMSQLFIE
jgi:hypothetical protein